MRTVFAGGRIIDGTGAPPIEEGVLVVEGDRIAAVGSRGEVPIPDDATVIDVAGQTVMPGMINTHEHLGQPDPDDPLIPDYPSEKDTSKASSQYLHTLAVRYGRQELFDGVTTVRILGERDGLDFGYRDAFDRGLVPGPRVIPSGPALCTSISHGAVVSRIVNGVDEVRGAVRDNIGAGAQVIKLFISGGRTMGVPYHLTTSFFTREEIQAAIDEAHKFDVKVTAHLNGGLGVDYAIEAGIDSLEHAMNLSDRELELVAKSGTWVCLTLTWFFTSLYERNIGNQADEVRAAVTRIRAAGVKVALGNDCCHADHFMARQVASLTEYGYSNMEALIIATRAGAEICGIADRRGVLAPDYDADVIVLGGDPLHDITSLKKVTTVMKAGVVHSV